MSRIKLLLDVVNDLRSLADSIAAMAGNEPTETAHTEIPAPEKAESPKPKTVTLEQIRAVLAEKSRDGYAAEVRTLLEKHGAPKLSLIDPVNFASLLADAEELGNG